MLKISDLHAEIEGKEILRGLDLEVLPGEVHAIMGPNGSGKSTLAHTLAGKDAYKVTRGSAVFDTEDLFALDPEERAGMGLFLAFQYPVEIPGVNNLAFLKASYNAIRKYRNETQLDSFEFMEWVEGKIDLLQYDRKFFERSVNTGFSGGEKKRNEIFQMAVLEPRLAILDETDSGLDVDAMRVIAEGVNSLRNPERAAIVITHYQRLLDYIVPDYVHVLYKGKIVKSGGRDLAGELDSQGYGWLEQAATSA